MFTVGLVKKLVFADQIGGVVDAAYSHAGLPSAPEALLAMYGFSVQIYCDFSGYTDMAIGLALCSGSGCQTISRDHIARHRSSIFGDVGT